MNKEILRKAIDTYGAEAQQDMVIEEALELALAILKHRRAIREVHCASDVERWRDNVVEERSDMEIMLNQVDIMFDCEERAGQIKDYKLKRLEKRLENGRDN